MRSFMNTSSCLPQFAKAVPHLNILLKGGKAVDAHNMLLNSYKSKPFPNYGLRDAFCKG